jgi:RNA polymerase sigma factor (sigma-70 family)
LAPGDKQGAIQAARLIDPQNGYSLKEFAHTSDEELLEQFYLHHDNRLLGVLLQRYTLLLLGVCMKYLKNEEEARDSVQQIFEKCIRELHRYKVTYLKSWLYMVAKNHCLMKLRERGQHRAAELDESMYAPEETPSRLEHLEKEKAEQLLYEALPQLGTEQKTCVTLFYLEKKSYQEIADRTGYNLLQVKSYIQNGKRNLKNLIEKKLNKETHGRH